MNDIDIEEGRRQMQYPGGYAWLADNAAAMFDAIETGQRWETIARQAAPLVARLARVLISVEAQEWLAAFRDVADRTPTPHHDGGVG